ncbi:hypothetical protein XO10_04540 [Marinitoga sp. 1135]|uniref:Transcriptional regulator/sugar kinase n=1 Tax=Marinitoga piezophila (strain DSM 14283 / JCM 11233 / KA3) TaxID=443254 RepID=H2J7U3_MARPK|nr:MULTISPECIES: ROK family transcriptional regulator [Marinitoga]AEX85434.1 transcriptional regulator/sugar kinase [Marinitoga piezophila KA3]APT75908.1 hypothetical protein LN42_05585 [Marinitoga sp. 1137]NUU95553.1 hypothetical protein [Marinitoga sp. 1135]NUU97573.1 hypothetical protein [Marinitoga sp. 1138]
MIRITDSLIKTLNFIWKKEKTYLMEISKETGLEKSTVSRSLNKLKDLNLIKKVDELSSTPQGGRKTTVFQFAYSIGHILGISVEQDGIEVALTDLAGKVISSKRISVMINEENIISQLNNVIESYSELDIYGIGISLPGIIDSKNGKIIYSKALNIRNFNLVSKIERKDNIPVYIENDSNCGALYFNLCNREKSKNILYFHISIPYYVNDGTGIGVGIIIKNRLYHGSNNYAGEVEIKKAMINDEKRISFEELRNYPIEKLLDNSREFLDYYSEKISNFISVFDPDTVLIGGNIVLLDNEFLDVFISQIKEKVFMFENRNIYLNHTSSKDFLTSRGAASLILHKMFSTKNGAEKFLEIYYNMKKRR